MAAKQRATELILQFLKENGYDKTHESLVLESGVDGDDVQIVAEHENLISLVETQLKLEQIKKDNFQTSYLLRYANDGNYAKKELCKLDNIALKANVLVSHLRDDGVLFSGVAKHGLCKSELQLPLTERSNENVIPSVCGISSAGVLSIDIHPSKQTLIATGSMDRSVCIYNTEREWEDPQMFTCHTKYVVRVCWSNNGDLLISGSYDKSICCFKKSTESDLEYAFEDRHDFIGAVEGVCINEVTNDLFVSVRGDHRIHVFNLSNDKALSCCKQINMNSLGDDFVSFNAMDVNISPDRSCLLISTDRNRLILIHIKSNKHIKEFFGCLSDDFSQPRNCWHPSGNYIYSTSDGNCILVYEVLTGKMVCSLEGHQGRVRYLSYSEKHSVLVSSSFDGGVRMWSNGN